MSASVDDIVNFGENKSRGPLYNRSVASLGTAGYVKVLSVNPSRKFLMIKPLSNHIHVHFLTPGVTDTAAASAVTDANSVTVASGNSDQPMRFETFVPTNAVWMKANTASVNVVIFEA